MKVSFGQNIMTNEEIKQSDAAALKRLVDYYEYFAQNSRQVLTNLDFVPLVISELSIGEIKKFLGYEREDIMSLPLDTTAFYHNYPPAQLELRKTLVSQALVEYKEVQWIRVDPNLWSVNEFMSCLSKITPLKNPITGNVIAFEFFTQVIDRIENVLFSPSLLGLKKSNLSRSAMVLGLMHNPYNLTRLQHEVLFMFCSQFSIKEIQCRLEELYQLSRSADSVRQVIKGMIQRLELNNREELIDFANKYGYANQIPLSMLSAEIIEVNSANAT